MDTPGNRNSARVSLLGPKSDLKGDLTTDDELVILGRVTGHRVQAPTVTVGPAARVTATIHASKVRIEGIVVGNVHAAESVIVQASARLRGEIHCPSIIVVEGAIINGGLNVHLGKADSGREAAERGPRSRAARRA